MDWVRVVTLGGLSFATKTVAMYDYITREASDPNAPVVEPVASVSIVLPAYNEENWLEPTLKSLRNQNILHVYPEMFEIIVVDSDSTDRTAEIASRYADKVLSSIRGKLNSRHVGNSEAKGELIIAVDADTIYPINTFNLLLQSFQDRKVVAVSGTRVSTDHVLNVGYVYRAIFDKLASNRMIGSISAFYKEAYLQAPFNLSINQFNRKTVFREEEIAFTARLKTLGKYVYNLKAPSITSPRYWYCPVGGVPKNCQSRVCQYCLEIALKQRF